MLAPPTLSHATCCPGAGNAYPPPAINRHERWRSSLWYRGELMRSVRGSSFVLPIASHLSRLPFLFSTVFFLSICIHSLTHTLSLSLSLSLSPSLRNCLNRKNGHSSWPAHKEKILSRVLLFCVDAPVVAAEDTNIPFPNEKKKSKKSKKKKTQKQLTLTETKQYKKKAKSISAALKKQEN